MFYHFELIMAGILLLTTMAAGGIVLWRKRRRDNLKDSQLNPNDEANSLP